jgi:hypothetical protein
VNRDMLERIARSFNGVAPTPEELEDFKALIYRSDLQVLAGRHACHASALVRALREAGWVVCPPIGVPGAEEAA